ncbi:MAG: hypothetical protein NBV67_07385, partial [Tagaea sp.]|nr:hypothetical protein [Tagaea sp.]
PGELEAQIVDRRKGFFGEYRLDENTDLHLRSFRLRSRNGNEYTRFAMLTTVTSWIEEPLVGPRPHPEFRGRRDECGDEVGRVSDQMGRRGKRAPELHVIGGFEWAVLR